jgi:hypothetical protein
VPSRSRRQLGLWIHCLLLLHVVLLYVSLGRLIEVLNAIRAQPRLILNLFLGKRGVGLGPIVGILLQYREYGRLIILDITFWAMQVRCPVVHDVNLLCLDPLTLVGKVLLPLPSRYETLVGHIPLIVEILRRRALIVPK